MIIEICRFCKRPGEHEEGCPAIALEFFGAEACENPNCAAPLLTPEDQRQRHTRTALNGPAGLHVFCPPCAERIEPEKSPELRTI